METPPFLEHLGLTEAISDEREIKRAYARLLKQIDQEADPAGFQKLREAYESSLGWFGWRAHQQAMQAQEDAERQAISSAEEAPTATTATDEPAAPMAQHAGDPRGRHIDDVLPPEPVEEAAPPAEPAAEPEIPRPQAHAAALFDEHFSTPCTEDDAAARLAACLDDDRLIDLEARAIFEYRIAHALAEGYTEGKHFLWKAAQVTFGWDEDHTRLRQFGRAGQVIENALNEQDFFERQDLSRIAYQTRVMERLRGDQLPQDTEFANLIPALEWMLATYPNLLWISTKAETVQRWRERHQQLAPHLQARYGQEQVQVPASEPASPLKHRDSWSGGYFLFMVCFMGLMGLLRYMGSNHTPSKYEADTAQRIEIQESVNRANQVNQGAPTAPLELRPPQLQGPATTFGTPASSVLQQPISTPQADHTSIEKLRKQRLEAERELRALMRTSDNTKPAPSRDLPTRSPLPPLKGAGDHPLEAPQIAPNYTPPLESQKDRSKLDGQIKFDNVKLGGS